jgi:hypothetical protein
MIIFYGNGNVHRFLTVGLRQILLREFTIWAYNVHGRPIYVHIAIAYRSITK